jgi:hypothetical protein
MMQDPDPLKNAVTPPGQPKLTAVIVDSNLNKISFECEVHGGASLNALSHSEL